MKKKLLVLLATSALLLMACDASSLVSQFVPGQQEEAQATEEPTEAPAKTQAAPTAAAGKTQAAPTKAPSGSTSGGFSFSDALGKAKTATKYRVEFAMIFGSTDKGQYKEAPFIDFAGEIDGANSHINSKGGLLSSMMTGSETGNLEIIEFGDKEYMKGATSLFGVIKLDPNTWYIANDKTAGSFADFAKPDEFSSFTGGTKDTDFKKVRSESLDSQSCDVYLYDMKSIQNAAIIGLLGQSQDKNEFNAIDKAEINVWFCGDGYVHKFMLEYSGHDTKDATQKGALKMNWHVWDVNSPLIVIQAPKDAKPMPK